MQKKLWLLSAVLFTNVTMYSQAPVIDWSALKMIGTVGGLGTMLGAGEYARKLNKKYAKQGKRPDAYLTVVKLVSGAALLIGVDTLLSGNTNTKDIVAKTVALAVSVPAGHDKVAQVVQHLPGLGFLVGPVNKDGEESKDVGAFGRILCFYLPFRQAALWIADSLG